MVGLKKGASMGIGAFELLDNVHVWVLQISAVDLEPCARLMDREELDRAERFRRSQDHDSFIVSHGVLRYLLGTYLQQEPVAIRFVSGAQGKPLLESETGVEFNITHSGDLTAMAFSSRCPVGIDLERIRPFAQLEQIARDFLSAEEASEITSLDGAEQRRAFFRCWTRKEAILKATGEGLSASLDSFRVTLLPEAPARLVHIGGNDEAAEPWVLQDLTLPQDYTGALAYRGQPRRATQFSNADLPQFRQSGTETTIPLSEDSRNRGTAGARSGRL
jgi:4'-phosphopantetheinyl transferase